MSTKRPTTEADRERMRQYHAANRAKLTAYYREYYKRNRDAALARSRAQRARARAQRAAGVAAGAAAQAAKLSAKAARRAAWHERMQQAAALSPAQRAQKRRLATKAWRLANLDAARAQNAACARKRYERNRAAEIKRVARSKQRQRDVMAMVAMLLEAARRLP